MMLNFAIDRRGLDTKSAYVRCYVDDGGCDEKKPNVVFSSLWILFGLWLFGSLTNTFVEEILLEGDFDFHPENGSLKIRSRSKRFVYMNSTRQLNLPPGSALDLESTASLPGISPLPTGIGSETAISVPFDVEFDTLGLTSSENTWGEIPFLERFITWVDGLRNKTRSFMFEIGNKDSVFVGFAKKKLTPKMVREQISKGGGHRPIMYQVIEDALYNLGIDGKACLLRTICEIHAEPLFGHGLFGEALELFLTVSSSSNYLHVLGEYLAAELSGKSSSDCSKYMEKCPLSLFGALTKKQLMHEHNIRKRFIEDESNYADYHTDGEHNGIKLTKKHLENMKYNISAMKTLSRQKRFFFFGPAGRLSLPVGTILIWKPQLKLPWMSNLPDGYKSSLKIGIPLKLIFDDLGLTSALNPFLHLPFLSTRRKRDTWKPLPGVNYAGGDRELIYAILEHTLDQWGLDGNACMLRAICEMHLTPLENHGFFGEILHLFFTPSKSPHARLRMGDYCDAETLGKKSKYCKPFYKACPHSIFISSKEKERRIAEMNNRIHDEDEDEKIWM